jgi:hypothetical protein
MVEAQHPIFAGKKSRKSRYVITDNFLAAWLAALSRNVDLARIRPLDEAIQRADIALQTHEGMAFEKMTKLMTEELSRSGKGDLALTQAVRGFWNKAGNSDIEVDLIAANEEEGVVRFGSCKRTAQRFTSAELSNFHQNVARFLSTSEGARFSNFEIQYALYSTHFSADIRRKLEAHQYICIGIDDFEKMLS